MRKTIMIAVVTMFSLAVAANALAAITGSSHDLSGGSGEICIYCHTPHGADTTEDVLWNHTVTSKTFADYTTSAGTAWGETAGINSSSLLCLSCHDGTVGLDAYGGATNSDFISGNALIANLDGSHPISIAYDDSVASLKTTPGTGIKLFNGDTLVECGSCHDVHNTDDTLDYLLRITNVQSALCIACHDK